MDSMYREPRYVISVAARMCGVRSYTLRYYEKIGIIEPSRSEGNIRLYSDEDIAKIKQMKTLMEDLGITIAGAEVILRMAQRITELQKRIEYLEIENNRLKKSRTT
ncbi:MAG TPA: MerR family transcriptional regulator [Dehalococcoidia bacterium]|nr:MerR family transcriptional regulator [Dehalococcoidia bacterium]